MNASVVLVSVAFFCLIRSRNWAKLTPRTLSMAVTLLAAGHGQQLSGGRITATSMGRLPGTSLAANGASELQSICCALLAHGAPGFTKTLGFDLRPIRPNAQCHSLR